MESHQACAEHSVSVEGGLFWTYSFNTKNCIIKSSDAGRTSNGGAVSGNRACGLAQQLQPLGVAVSQQWTKTDDYPADQCADSNPSTFCVVAEAPFPWLAIFLNSKARVEIWTRTNWRGFRLRNFEVRVTDSLPSSGICCLNANCRSRSQGKRGSKGEHWLAPTMASQTMGS